MLPGTMCAWHTSAQLARSQAVSTLVGPVGDSLATSFWQQTECNSCPFVQSFGPPWAWAMFTFERFWSRLGQTILQTRHSQATIMNAVRVTNAASCPIQIGTAEDSHVFGYDEDGVNPDEQELPSWVSRDIGIIRIQFQGFIKVPHTELMLNDHRRISLSCIATDPANGIIGRCDSRVLGTGWWSSILLLNSLRYLGI